MKRDPNLLYANLLALALAFAALAAACSLTSAVAR